MSLIIYTVTTIKTLDYKEAYEKRWNNDRTPGYFSNWEDADKCIIENWGDIYENGHFPYAVIEKVGEGLYAFEGRISWWYKWDNSIGGYRHIDIPDEMKCTIGHGIG